MMRALLLAASLLVASQALAAGAIETATACKNKGDNMHRSGDRGDAWMWFCMEQNRFVFSHALCTYSTSAIYKPECWMRRPRQEWPS